MVRTDGGVKFPAISRKPAYGTISHLVEQKQAIPGPADYDVRPKWELRGGQFPTNRIPRVIDDIVGKARYKPGVGTYSIADPVNTKLPGYTPWRVKQAMLRQGQYIPQAEEKKPWRVIQSTGVGKHSICMVGGGEVLGKPTVEELSRPTHTSCRPGARLVAPKIKLMEHDSLSLYGKSDMGNLASNKTTWLRKKPTAYGRLKDLKGDVASIVRKRAADFPYEVPITHRSSHADAEEMNQRNYAAEERSEDHASDDDLQYNLPSHIVDRDFGTPMEKISRASKDPKSLSWKFQSGAPADIYRHDASSEESDSEEDDNDAKPPPTSPPPFKSSLKNSRGNSRATSRCGSGFKKVRHVDQRSEGLAAQIDAAQAQKNKLEFWGQLRLSRTVEHKSQR